MQLTTNSPTDKTRSTPLCTPTSCALFLFAFLCAANGTWAEAPPHLMPTTPGPPILDSFGNVVYAPAVGDVAVPHEDERGFQNLALNDNAKPDASSVYAHGALPVHQIEHLNDGLAGNSHSWAGHEDPSWVEIDLGEVYWVYKVAFASDASLQHTERPAVAFSIRSALTHDKDSYAETWNVLYQQETGPAVHDRHEFSFDPVQARWIRVSIDKRTGLNVRIDELEIYGQKNAIPPERLRPVPGSVPMEAAATTLATTEPGSGTEPAEIEKTLRYAFLGEEHAWLKTYGRADLADYLVPYNGLVKEYPRHVGDDTLPLPALSSSPEIDGQLDDACWNETSRGVVRVAHPYIFEQTPLVEHEVHAGWREDTLYLGVQVDRILSAHIAIVSSADWNGCGIVAVAKEGLVFLTYNSNYEVVETTPLQGACDLRSGLIEVGLPISLFPGCKATGLRVGLGMGGRHTPNHGRPVNFSFAPLAIAQTASPKNGVFPVRLTASGTGQTVKLSCNVPGLESEIVLKPAQSKIVEVPAPLGPIGPEFDLQVTVEGGDSYVLHLFRYDPLHRTLVLMEEMLDRLTEKGHDLRSERQGLKRLQGTHERLLSTSDGITPEERAAFYQARVAKRELLFMDRDLSSMEDLLFVKRNAFLPSHIYTDYTDAPFRPGGAVCALTVPKVNGRLNPGQAVIKTLFDAGDGIARNPVTDYDREKIYFGYRPTEDGYYHIQSMDADGSELEQITDGPFHDFYPCSLSDGNLAFISTRCTSRVFCFRGGASVLFRMTPEGENIRPISRASLNEWAPSQMNDGRIIWTRWEYVDKGADFTQTLWSIRPDGTHPELVFGNTVLQPNGYASGREVPGTNEIACTLVSHFGDINGPIALIDLNQGRFNPKAIKSITPEVPWPGMWPREECFRDPIPLSSDYFLCSHAPRETFGLYVLDRYGNREVVHLDPTISSMYPTLFSPQPRPPVLAEHIVAQDEVTEDGTLMLTDVYQGISPAVQRGRVKYLRVVREVRHNIDMLPSGEYRKDHEQFLQWYASPVDLVYGPFGWPAYVAKASLGLVPVEEDGSAYFRAPSGQNLYLQALDEDFNELQRMRSLVHLQPGESRSCIGCHENRNRVPAPHRPIAAQRQPDQIQAPPWGDGPVFYDRVVQPVLNAKCVGCHNEDHPSKLDFTGTHDENSIPTSYRTFITQGLVHFVDCGWNSGGCEKLEPLTFGNVKSKLWDVLDAGHHDVVLTKEERRRIKTWTALNCPLWGDYIERSQRRPRIGAMDLGTEERPSSTVR